MICIVPARGGSKGLPRKNVLPFLGKPLIVHTLECALASGRIDRVIVTTDDDEIADVASSVVGVEVPFRRPKQFAQDDTLAVEVHAHVVNWLTENEGAAPRSICVLLPTAPLRLPEDVDACIDLFEKHNAAIVLSVVAAKPIAWQQLIDNDGKLSAVPGIESNIENRQALGRAVIPNGAVQVFDMPELRRTGTYFGPRSYGHEMPADRSVDIDTSVDFRIAEILMRARMAA